MYPLWANTKAHENPKELSLTGFAGINMRTKIRAKNWATLFEISPSKETKIKSVAQSILVE